jgi:polar amino acid transport system permease protein
MSDFSTWDILRNLLLAARWTVVLSLVSFVGGGVLGVILLFLRIGRLAPARLFARYYVELFQGTPLLMQLFLAFFGLGLLGINVPAWLAAGMALILWTAAFLVEIWRGCVDAVVKGQWEASASLGMGYLQQMRYVILPQAIRIAVPPTVGFSVQVVKGTALPALHGLRHRGPHLFRPVLAAVKEQPGARKEAQCRSSKSLKSAKRSATTRY